VAIARFPILAIDCPDPTALATFYGMMLGWEIIEAAEDRAAVRAEYGQCISFHRVEAYVPPTWPSQVKPQQMHLDALVDDIDAAEVAVLDLGATKSEHQPGTSYRVFLDPAGHPFCLCTD
jgi:catechol 2,3-dioxygenase-like lactoylglutathione lyase family enzyme